MVDVSDMNHSNSFSEIIHSDILLMNHSGLWQSSDSFISVTNALLSVIALKQPRMYHITTNGSFQEVIQCTSFLQMILSLG